MGEPWSDIVAHLRGQRLLAPQSLQERLPGLADPKSVIEAATALNMSGGMLTATMLDDMIAHATEPPLQQRHAISSRSGPPSPGRPGPHRGSSAEPEPVDLLLRNNLPTESTDFSSTPAIPGHHGALRHHQNSTTEGK